LATKLIDFDCPVNPTVWLWQIGNMAVIHLAKLATLLSLGEGSIKRVQSSQAIHLVREDTQPIHEAASNPPIVPMLSKLIQASEKLSPSNRKIIGNTGWLFASRVFRIGVSLLISTWIARYLGPNRYGILQYALAFCSFFLPLSTAQMGPVTTRDLVQSPDSKHTILGSAFTLQLGGGCLAAVLAVSAIWLLAPGDATLQLLVAIISLKFVFNSFQPIENWFEAKVASKFRVFASNLAFIGVTTLEICLVLYQAPLIVFAVTIILETLIFSLGLIFFYCRDGENILHWRTDRGSIQYLIKESFPLVLSSTAWMIYTSIDRVMLGNMIDSKTVGIYSSAATLSESLSFLPIIVCSSLYPAIIQAKNQSKSAYQAKLQKFYDLLSGLAYGLILLLLPLSGWVITFLYGEPYRPAVPILMVYLWSCLFSFQGIAQSKWIVSEGLQRFDFYSRLAGLISNISLNLILIPRYQGMGAAIATLISYAIGGYLYFLLVPATRANAMLMTKALCLPVRVLSLR
jgi:polysaccharide transporter, PST family